MTEDEKKALAAEELLKKKKEILQVDKEIEAISKRKGKLGEDELRVGRDLGNIVQSNAKLLNLSYNEKRKISSITKKLNDLAEKTYTFDNKSLGTVTKSSKVNKQILDAQQKLKILALQKLQIYNKESNSFVEQVGLRKEINQGITEQILLSGRVIKQLERQASIAKEIEGNKIANSFGTIGNVLNKIPVISALAPAFKSAEEAARKAGAEVTVFSKGMADASDYSKKGLAKLGPDAQVVSNKKYNKEDKAVKKMQKKDPEAAAAMIGTNKPLFGAAAQKSLEAGTAKLKGVTAASASSAAGFAKMIPMLGKLIAAFAFSSLLQADKNVTSFQKNLGVSQKEARKLNHQVNAIANSSYNLRVNIDSLNKALGSLNDSYGTALMFNDETLETSAALLDSKIMDGEATARLSQSARLNGMEMKVALTTQEAAVNSVNKEHNTRISLKKVLQDSNKITGQIRAQLAANPEAIAEAVTHAKALGMELNQVAAAGKQMLDFESSIEAELTAELMLGKEINLEKARLAALTGDYETLTKEINKNVGDFSDFTKMNVLQQDALAKSVGMTADGLADQLMKKADLELLTKEALDSGDKQLAQDLMALSAQEKFEKAVIKVKDAFVSVMSILQPIVWTIGLIADGISFLIPVITTLTVALAVMNRKIIFGAIAAAYKNAMQTFSGIPGIGWGLGIAAGLASVAIIKGAAAKAGDVSSPADGKTQISTKEGGLFELSKNDDVAAGPGILDKLNKSATGLFPVSGGGTNIEPLVTSFNILTTIMSSKFDLLIQTITQQQGEGNKLQKNTSDNLNANLSTLTSTDSINKSIHKKLATGMVAASAGIFGMGVTAAIASDVMSKETIGITQETPVSTPMNTSGFSENQSTTSIESPSTLTTSLEKKLDEIKAVLLQKQTIKLDVNNKITHDAFSENTVSYLNGKEAQETINDSSFV